MAGAKGTVTPGKGEGRGWTVDQSGPTRRASQELARLGGGELEIHGRNGRIREARTLGVKENRRSKV